MTRLLRQLALLCFSGCATASWSSNGEGGSAAATGASVPFVDVRLNGQGPFSFMVDTGDDRTLMTAKVAKKLGLKLARGGTAIGIVGTEETRTVRVQTVETGGITANDVTMIVGVLPDRGVDGLLGHNFLRWLRVVIDYPNHRLTFQRPTPEPPPSEPSVPDVAPPASLEPPAAPTAPATVPEIGNSGAPDGG